MYTFEYDGETLYSREFELEELGQVCLEAIDSECFSYYLIIRTSLGQSSILEYGPLVTDSKLVPYSTSIKFQRIDFKDIKLKQIIKMFLAPRNKGKNKIVEVHQLDVKEALSRGVNLLEYMESFSDVSNY